MAAPQVKTNGKLKQNFQAFMFIMNFISLVILAGEVVSEAAMLLDVKVRFVKIAGGWRIIPALIILFSYTRLYMDYIRNKRWNS